MHFLSYAGGIYVIFKDYVIKLECEVGNLDKAFELWQNLVKQKGVGNNAILLSRRAIISKGVDYVMD